MTPRLDRDIATWIAEARPFAHAEHNWIRIAAGETIQSRGFASILRHREHAAGFESVVFLQYSVDVGPDGSVIRHLSVSLDVPGKVSQGDINAGATKEFAQEFLAAFVRVVFPLHDHVNLRAIAEEPRPVVTEQRQATWRTRVTFHVWVDHLSTEGVAGVTMPRTQERQSGLLGPDGRPLRR